jgi:hypothetical protein
MEKAVPQILESLDDSADWAAEPRISYPDLSGLASAPTQIRFEFPEIFFFGLRLRPC